MCRLPARSDCSRSFLKVQLLLGVRRIEAITAEEAEKFVRDESEAA